VHFTRGGPWFENLQDVDYGELWRAERDALAKAPRPAHADQVKGKACG
jgi:hypothetical protein